MGRGSPVCQQIREKIIEMFKNNVPQRKIVWVNHHCSPPPVGALWQSGPTEASPQCKTHESLHGVC